MQRRNLFATVLLTAAIASAAYWAAAESAPKAEVPNPFQGKVITISSKTNPEYGAVLESVSIRQLGDQSFLVGKGVNHAGAENWQKGRTVWFAVSDASQIVEFDTVEELMQAGGGR